jgi:hypothetical protein
VDVKCFTSNGVVKSNGHLVMGAGTARIVKDMYPYLPSLLGSDIMANYKKTNGVYSYGFIFNSEYRIGALQTKYHFKDNSSVEIIKFALSKLTIFANANRSKLIGIVYPGIGLGNLRIADVEYLLEGLPANVLIFKLK